MRMQSTLHLLVSPWATLLLLSIAASGFQNNPRTPWSQFGIHVHVQLRQPLPLSLNTMSQLPRSRIRPSASTHDQDASTSDYVNGDTSCSVARHTEEFQHSFDEMEIQNRQENNDTPLEIARTSWSYWSTGSQLVQAGAVGATTGLLVAIFKLVRYSEMLVINLTLRMR
jgi:hypothetical protein